jgi:DamX protein
MSTQEIPTLKSEGIPEDLDLHALLTNNAHSNLFYQETERVHLLNLLSYMLEFGGQLILVTGKEGMGKTSLLNEFQNSAPKNWKLCVLQAKLGLESDEFILSIAEGFGLSRTLVVDTNIESLRDYFEGVCQSALVPVLAIDDAHLLSINHIDILLKLYHEAITDGHQTLHIVLFGDVSLKQVVDEGIIANDLGIDIREFGLAPFSEKSCEDYIRQRMKLNGFFSKSIHSKKWFTNVHKQTQGVPALLNDYITEALLVKARPNIGVGRNTILAAVAISLAVVFVLLFLYSTEQVPDEKNSIKGQEIAQYIQHDEPGEIKPSLGSKEVQDQETIAPDTTVLQPEADLEELQEKQVSQVPREVLVVIDKEQSILEVEHRAEVQMDQEQASDDKQNLIEETVSLETTNFKREQWLLQQDAGSYGLQIMGLHDQSALTQFIKDHDLSTSAAYYQKRHKGRDWFVLIYGVFPSSEDALIARKALPKTIQKMQPFLRTFSSIHKDINSLKN